MSRHEPRFEGRPLREATKTDRETDAGTTPRGDLLIRLLSGEDMDEAFDGAFARPTRLTRDYDK